MMPVALPKSTSSPTLVCGDDEFSIKRAAREAFGQWCAGTEGADQEIIDASVSSSGEALKALVLLREALQTLPFFGNAKVIWFQNCNFLGDERAATAQAVTEDLAQLAQELRHFVWDNVRLLISAGKVDKRKTFYKTFEKIGKIHSFTGWTIDDRDWQAQAESWADQELRDRGKKISEDALAEFVLRIGPNARQLSNEAEKLVLFVGERNQIHLGDVNAIVTRNKHARAFSLGDALGVRDLPRVLRTLDEELWGLKSDNQKSEIGLLYGLISKVRVLLLIKEMLREGRVTAESDYSRFKTQLSNLPADLFPVDKRFNPLTMNPYILFKALPQAACYESNELVRAMEVLLECNQHLVLSGLDEALILQRALVQIVNRSGKIS
jgi:DNA polymerase III subunit delta